MERERDGKGGRERARRWWWFVGGRMSSFFSRDSLTRFCRLCFSRSIQRSSKRPRYGSSCTAAATEARLRARGRRKWAGNEAMLLQRRSRRSRRIGRRRRRFLRLVSLCVCLSLSLSLLAAGSSSSGGPLLLLPLPPLPLLPRSTTAELQDRGAASPQIMHSLWNNSAPPPKRTTLKSILVTVETFSPIEYLSTSAPSLVLYPVLRRLLVTNLGLPGFDHLCSTSSKML